MFTLFRWRSAEFSAASIRLAGELGVKRFAALWRIKMLPYIQGAHSLDPANNHVHAILQMDLRSAAEITIPAKKYPPYRADHAKPAILIYIVYT
jgi:hypothetical protein